MKHETNDSPEIARPPAAPGSAENVYLPNDTKIRFCNAFDLIMEHSNLCKECSVYLRRGDGDLCSAGKTIIVTELCFADTSIEFREPRKDPKPMKIDATLDFIPQSPTKDATKVRIGPKVSQTEFIIVRQDGASFYAPALTPFVHPTVEAAEAEAEHLAVENPGGKFVVFCAWSAWKTAAPVASKVSIK